MNTSRWPERYEERLANEVENLRDKTKEDLEAIKYFILFSCCIVVIWINGFLEQVQKSKQIEN